jgi:hypothetical protein
MKFPSALCAVLVVSLAASVLLPPDPAAASDPTIRHERAPWTPPAGDFGAGLDYLARHRDLPAAHVWIQTEEIGPATWRASLADEGIRLLNYVPEKSWIAAVSPDLTPSDLERLGIRWMGPLRLVDKVSWRILEGEEAPWAEYENGQRIYVVVFHKDVDAAAAEAVLSAYPHVKGPRIETLGAQVVAMDPALVTTLAMEDAVKWVDVLPPPLEAVNDGVRAAIQVDEVHQAPYGLDGTGSNILVYDAGLVDRNHPDFSPNRVTWGEGGSVITHSTHVAGTVGGNGTSNPLYKGMAPNTLITSYLYEACSPHCLYNSPQDIEENYAEGFLTYGADLASNSLGSNIALNGYPCSWEGDYELTAQLLDAICVGNWNPGRPFLSVWAAGNERAYGTCGVEYYTTGVPATAKNIIAVGATNSNNHSMTYFSSWGPVDDGRIRPDVCAPGCQQGGDGGVTSTRPGGGYTTLCGTSMATPAVSGVLALILQEWRSGPAFTPPPLPSTLKAILINTAQDYGNPGPDFQFGFGEIRARDAIDHMREGTLLESQLDQGEEHTYVFDVPAGESKIRATVAWSDEPGEILAERELVNDLDIWLEDPDGQIHLPYVLNPNNPYAPATTGYDHLNPVEQVEVESPVAGLWTLHVLGTEVPMGPQAYSVAVNQPYVGSGASAVGEERLLTDVARLAPARPNPFHETTTLRFTLGREAPVKLAIYDAAGRRVRTLVDGALEAGVHQLAWDGRDARGQLVPAGVYFARLGVGPEVHTRSLVFVR